MNECEDANIIDGDGCSSLCKIEDTYACKSESPSGPFSCWETIPPTLKSGVAKSNT